VAVTHADRLTGHGELDCAAEAAALITFRIAHDVAPRWLALFASATSEALDWRALTDIDRSCIVARQKDGSRKRWRRAVLPGSEAAMLKERHDGTSARRPESTRMHPCNAGPDIAAACIPVIADHLPVALK
jgi:hypothetical protein